MASGILMITVGVIITSYLEDATPIGEAGMTPDEKLDFFIPSAGSCVAVWWKRLKAKDRVRLALTDSNWRSVYGRGHGPRGEGRHSGARTEDRGGGLGNGLWMPSGLRWNKLRRYLT